jgi:3-methyladenine DNA glycosylase Tag
MDEMLGDGWVTGQDLSPENRPSNSMAKRLKAAFQSLSPYTAFITAVGILKTRSP